MQPAAVVVGFAPPSDQRRATIGFRLILAVPHIILLGIFTFVGVIVTIVAWFAALFTGRVPSGMFDLVARFLRYGTRVHAYLFLLTDRYPPFDLLERDYPISVEFTPTRLNRAAVLFRVVLVIPSQIVASLVYAGATVAAVVIWVLALVRGRMPRAPFEALGATLRFQVRTLAFLALLTPEQPRGLFGDKSEPTERPSLPPAPSSTPSELAPPSAAAWPAPIAPPPSALARPSGAAGSPPHATRLVLTQAAKRLIVLFLVLGTIEQVVLTTITAINSTRIIAIGELNSDYKVLSDSYHQYRSAVTDCGNDLPCLHTTDSNLALDFSTFADDLDSIDFPSGSLVAETNLASDARAVAAALTTMAHAPSSASRSASAAEFHASLGRFDTDYAALTRTL